MTVQELIDNLQKIKNKSNQIIVTYQNVTYSGGCDTCGYGAVSNHEEMTSSDVRFYDFGNRVVIEAVKE